MFKQEKGVTLVALVITIIVLLILAGVSISMVAGDNGVLTRASKSSLKTKYGATCEAVNLACAELQSEYADKMADGEANESDIPNYYTEAKMVDSLEKQGYIIAGPTTTGEGASATTTYAPLTNTGDATTTPLKAVGGAGETVGGPALDSSSAPKYRVYAKGAEKDYILVQFSLKSMGYSASYDNTLGTTTVK